MLDVNQGTKVSALMACQNRPQVWEAIDCFTRQTHPKRELIAVTADQDMAFREQLQQKAAETNGMIVELAPIGTPLGELRNLTIHRATGEYLVQWDDDDLSAPGRMEWQLGKMIETGARVSYLREFVHHFLTDGRRTTCHWHNGLPGTVMFHQSVAVEYDKSLNSTEDSHFKEEIRKRGIPLALLDNDPNLYTYRFHGDNTWSWTHHNSVSFDHMKLD